MTHVLKTWPQYFRAIKSGLKTFEIRRDDRGFKVGDTLILKEWQPESPGAIPGYTGHDLEVQVTYITDWEQKPPYIVMGIKPKRTPTT